MSSSHTAGALLTDPVSWVGPQNDLTWLDNWNITSNIWEPYIENSVYTKVWGSLSLCMEWGGALSRVHLASLFLSPPCFLLCARSRCPSPWFWGLSHCRWRMPITSPIMWRKISLLISIGRGKTTVMATTLRCRLWQRCTTDLWRFISMAQVCPGLWSQFLSPIYTCPCLRILVFHLTLPRQAIVNSVWAGTRGFTLWIFFYWIAV